MKHHLIKFFKGQLVNIGPSRKFFLILLIFIFGICVHSFTKFLSWSWLIWTVLILLIAIIVVSIKFKNLIFVGVLLIIFMVGLALYESSLKIPGNDVSLLNGQKITLRGLISAEPDHRLDHQKLEISVKSLTSRKDADSNAEKRGSISGKLLVRTALYPEFAYGDEVELTCYLQKPEPIQDFAYDEYLARFDIYSVCFWPENLVIMASGKGNWLMREILLFKKRLSQNVSAALPEPYASLGRGISLGERGTIPRTIQENFRRAGLSHILAISGFNITIVVSIFGYLINWLVRSRITRFLATTLGIILFVLMVGADTSVVRAAIMGILVIIAKSNARFPPPRITLTVTGAIMLAINPKLIAFDRGFLLSFAATIGIIYFSPLLQNYFSVLKIFKTANKFKQEIYKYFGELICSTFAAIIFTLPLTMYFFKNISLVAVVANLLIVPFTPAIMIASLLVGLVGFISFLSNLIAPALYVGIYFVEFLSRFFARIPGASLSLAYVSWIIMPVFYGIIFYIAWLIKTKIKRLELLKSLHSKPRPKV